jgi:hypothetical protein
MNRPERFLLTRIIQPEHSVKSVRIPYDPRPAGNGPRLRGSHLCGSGLTLDADHRPKLRHLARQTGRIRGIDHLVDVLVGARGLLGHAA